MHDAKWRSSFGGSIYKTGGSHGCINLPHSVAKKIYENIASGMPVLCYNLPGTESGGSSQKPSEPTPAPTPPVQLPEPTPAPELPPTLPAEPPTEAPPETTAPAGPASDHGAAGALGPGAE